MSQGVPIRKHSMSEIKSKLLKPALTSHYICNFQPPNNGFIKSRLNTTPIRDYDYLSLACSDAVLPGSSLATVDITNDFHGLSEKHAYRRLYDDRADFSFYVDANDYYCIRFFEAWIAYTVDEQLGSNPSKREYSYRVNYPDLYCTDNLSIIKFDRDYETGEQVGLTKIPKKTNGRSLTYNFVKAFPISIQSMPVSYETSQLLKCTVSFTYSRYWISGLTVASNSSATQNSNAPGVPDLLRFSDPGLQASYNRLNNPLSGQGYNDSALDQASLRALTPTDTSNITVNTFQN